MLPRSMLLPKQSTTNINIDVNSGEAVAAHV